MLLWKNPQKRKRVRSDFRVVSLFADPMIRLCLSFTSWERSRDKEKSRKAAMQSPTHQANTLRLQFQSHNPSPDQHINQPVNQPVNQQVSTHLRSHQC